MIDSISLVENATISCVYVIYDCGMLLLLLLLLNVMYAHFFSVVSSAPIIACIPSRKKVQVDG